MTVSSPTPRRTRRTTASYYAQTRLTLEENEIQQVNLSEVNKKEFYTFSSGEIDVDWGETVGEGNFSTCYLGRITTTTTTTTTDNNSISSGKVVIKHLKDTEKNTLLLFKEAEILAKLCNHPNIVKFLGILPLKTNNQQPPCYCLVTELAEFGNLENLLVLDKYAQRSKFQFGDLLRVITDVATAMEFLHDCKILHCDLAARNILMDANGGIKLTDFGLSRYSGRDNHDVPWVGAVKYMAAETFVKASLFTEKSDVYSFGVVIYEIFCGALPFAWEVTQEPQEIYKNAKERSTNVCLDCIASRELRQLVKQTWDFNPELRPSAKAMVETLVKLNPAKDLTTLVESLASAISIATSNNNNKCNEQAMTTKAASCWEYEYF